MEIDSISIVIFVSSLIPTLITLYLTEKVKGNIKNSFDMKLEIVKRDHFLEISKFQTELNFFKTKENFKFTKLHEKRLEVLEKTYKLLNNTLNALNFYVTPLKQIAPGTTFEENEDKLLENFADAQNDFVIYYSDNKIYFGEEIEELIDSYISETIDVFNDYNQKYFMKKLGNKFDEESYRKASHAYKKIPEKIIPIKKEIENKFKALLEN